MRRWMVIFGIAGLVFSKAILAAEIPLKQTDSFVAGVGEYHTYRIPVIVVATNGAVLVFCEGRKAGAGDSGNIDLLLKRSLDGGETWQAKQIVREGAGNVCGNPAPVVDQVTGEIFLLSTWNRGSDTEKMILAGTSADTRRVFVQSSKDNGATWSAAREITADVKKSHWRWYATGPCNGIQLISGSHRGRLLIPANHSDHSDPARHPYRSHVIYSDDHGATWNLGGVEEEKTNESTLVELSNGDILQNMRSYHGKNCRAVAISHDGGLTFSPVALATNLIDSVCQASMLRLHDGKILFANPASTKREKMTIRVSSDDAKTWPISKVLHEGPSAYSGLAELPDGAVLCLYECGEKSAYERITLARIPIHALSAEK